MNFQYEAQFQIDLGKAIPEVGHAVNRINTHLASDGYDGKLKILAPIHSVVVTADRELTEQ